MGSFDQFFLYIIFSFILSFLWAPLLINILYKYKLVRQSEQDFSHLVGDRYKKTGVPVLGGLLIVITTIFITLIFNRKFPIMISIFVFMISAILGGLDEVLNIFGRKKILRTFRKQIVLARVHKKLFTRIKLWITLPWVAYKNIWYVLGSYPGKGIHAGEKVIVQIFLGGVVAWWLYVNLGITTVWLPWFNSINLGFFMPVFIIFTVVSMTNAVNISDGMDGLSSGMLIPVFFTFMFLAGYQGQSEFAILNATIIGSLLAYLYFNIKPARWEMGDVGSLALGTILATNAFLQEQIVVLPIAGFMFVIIIGSSLLQSVVRKVFGKRLLKMAPLHLHFQIVGWTEEKIVMRFWLFSLIFSIIGVWIGLQ